MKFLSKNGLKNLNHLPEWILLRHPRIPLAVSLSDSFGQSHGFHHNDFDHLPMKRGRLLCLLMVIGIYTVVSLWDNYTSRPVALYERWFGAAVPSDVAELDGLSKFAITESTNWLSFRTSQQRIDQIVARLGMDSVTASKGWQKPNVTQVITIAGKTYHTNWFDDGFFRFQDHLAEIQVYWRGHRSDHHLTGGYALYFVPSTGQAFYTSISI